MLFRSHVFRHSEIADHIACAGDAVELAETWLVFVDFLVLELLSFFWLHVFQDYLVYVFCSATSFSRLPVLLVFLQVSASAHWST